MSKKSNEMVKKAKEMARAKKEQTEVHSRKSWKEMSRARRGTNIVLMLVELALTSWALWDIKQRPEKEINGKKRTWVMTSFIQPFGPIAYLVFGRKKGQIPQAA